MSSADFAAIEAAFRNLGAEPLLVPVTAASADNNTPDDDPYERLVTLARHPVYRQMQLDMARGDYAVDDVLAVLEEARQARLELNEAARRWVYGGDAEYDNATRTSVFVQSIAQPENAPEVNPPNQMWTWTKYYRGVSPLSSSSLVSNTKPEFDLLSSLASCSELMLYHICVHLSAADVFRLYCTSRIFHASVQADQARHVLRLARHFAPDATAVFPWHVYGGGIDKHSDGLHPQSALPTQSVIHPTLPTMKYLSFVSTRQRMARDILACLARFGHRVSHVQSRSIRGLLKIWLLLDIGTTRERKLFIADRDVFSDQDLLAMQLVLVKLIMYFSADGMWHGILNGRLMRPLLPPEPLFAAFMGRRSLEDLWRLMRRKEYHTPLDMLRAQLQYRFPAGSPAEPRMNPSVDDGLAIAVAVSGLPITEVGILHLEGWGAGTAHLMRPDELVPFEAFRRKLDWQSHLPFLPTWGQRDWSTGENLVPTLDEMYMSDDDLPPVHAMPRATPKQRLLRCCGNVPFDDAEWKPWQVLKGRWPTLSLRDKLDIWWISHQDRLKTQAWARDEDEETGGVNADVCADKDIDDSDDSDDDIADVDLHNNVQGMQALAPAYSSRHRNLIDSYVHATIAEQEAADIALLEQADQHYSDDEMNLWEEKLAEWNVDDDEENQRDQEPIDANDDTTLVDADANANTNTANPDADPAVSLEAAVAATSRFRVLVPSFGDDADVMELVQMMNTAEAALGRAENVEQTERATAVLENLKKRLEHRLEEEVFSMDFVDM